MYCPCQQAADFQFPQLGRQDLLRDIGDRAAKLHIAVISMKYDARAYQFNMDTGCVELLLRDGRKISIDCTGVEDALDATIAQRSGLDYLIYNDPLAYAELILNGNPEEYLKNVTGNHGLED